jgi:transcriptional regulator with XRE-family HTH domain
MSPTNLLGEFLRARRDLVRPEDAGLPPGTGRRRVLGLRREEVALLAGISSEYYLRLEQGRDQHPSPQVIDSLARVLHLEHEAAAYLRKLAEPEPEPEPGRRRPQRRAAERVGAGLRQFVLSRTDTPAFVQGRYMDVLVANPLATALSPCYREGANLLRSAFLDPQVRALYEDWEQTSASTVASLRTLAGPESNDARLAELVGELSVRSDEFRRLWARHDVRPRTSGVARIHHPQVGLLELNYEKLAVTGADGQLLVIYHAEPGSQATERLALLAHLADEPASQTETFGARESPST